MNYSQSKNVWYFAYGSNIERRRMTSRGVTPLESRPVVVKDYILTFDIFGIPYAEPAFASIAPIDTGNKSAFMLRGLRKSEVIPVHGVAYLLTAPDYHRLVVSEGSGIGYREIEVLANILSQSRNDGVEPASDPPIIARTLVAKYPWRPNRAPSKRYLNIMLTGAEEWHLPDEYVHHLAQLPYYELDPSWQARAVANAFLMPWRTINSLLARLSKVSVNDQGHCKPWFGTAVVIIYRLMWFSHDYVFSLFGHRGDGLIK